LSKKVQEKLTICNYMFWDDPKISEYIEWRHAPIGSSQIILWGHELQS
jgi:hypothetical protein